MTPKTTGGLEPLPTRLVLPYGVISAVLAAAALIGEASTRSLRVRIPLCTRRHLLRGGHRRGPCASCVGRRPGTPPYPSHPLFAAHRHPACSCRPGLRSVSLLQRRRTRPICSVSSTDCSPCPPSGRTDHDASCHRPVFRRKDRPMKRLHVGTAVTAAVAAVGVVVAASGNRPGSGPPGIADSRRRHLLHAAGGAQSARSYSDNGTARPSRRILADHGANYVRLRLWVNPPEGQATWSRPWTLARRAHAAGTAAAS